MANVVMGFEHLTVSIETYICAENSRFDEAKRKARQPIFNPLRGHCWFVPFDLLHSVNNWLDNNRVLGKIEARLDEQIFQEIAQAL
jgi:hypothetical protein